MARITYTWVVLLFFLSFLPFVFSLSLSDCTQLIDLGVNEYGAGTSQAGEVDCYKITLTADQIPTGVSGNELIFYSELESTQALVYYGSSLKCTATPSSDCRLPAQAGEYIVVVSAYDAYSFRSWLKTGAQEVEKGDVVEEYVPPFTPGANDVTMVEQIRNPDGTVTYQYLNDYGDIIGSQTGFPEGTSSLPPELEGDFAFNLALNPEVVRGSGFDYISPYNLSDLGLNLYPANFNFMESFRFGFTSYSFAAWSGCDEGALAEARALLNRLKSNKADVTQVEEELILVFIEEKRPFDKCVELDQSLEDFITAKMNAVKVSFDPYKTAETESDLYKASAECRACDDQFEKLRKELFYYINPHERYLEPLEDISFGLFAISIPLMFGSGMLCPETAAAGGGACWATVAGGLMFAVANIMDIGIDSYRASVSFQEGDALGTTFHGGMAVWGVADATSPGTKKLAREATRLGLKKTVVKKITKHLTDDVASYLAEQLVKGHLGTETLEEIIELAAKNPDDVAEFLRAVKNRNLALGPSLDLFKEKGFKSLGLLGEQQFKKTVVRNGREWVPAPDDIPASTYNDAKQKLDNILKEHGLDKGTIVPGSERYVGGTLVEWTVKTNDKVATVSLDLGTALNGPNTKHFGIKLTDKAGSKAKTTIHIYDEAGNWPVNVGRELLQR